MADVDQNSDKHRRRRILSQVLASLGNAFQYFSLGAAINYGAVEVAGLSTSEYENDIIKPTENDLSWIGSICFIMQATGNLMGGPSTAYFGRKRAMLIGNLPYIVGWILMWQSKNVATLLLGNAFLGLGTGLLCSPMASYTGEIVQPSVRGVLASLSEVLAGLGAMGVFILGTLVSWRTTAAIYLGEALFATFVLIWLPESPIWLLSKGRDEDALRSLCWLRGWVQPEDVKKEFHELIAYNKHSMKCRKCDKIGINSIDEPQRCPHANESLLKRFKSVLSDYNRIEARRPLILSCMFFIFSSMTSWTSVKPTMINLLKAYNVPVDPRWAMAGVGVLTILGALLCMALVKTTGKRPLAIGSMLGSCIFTFALAVYAHTSVDPSISSYDDNIQVSEETSIGPLIFFVLMVFCNTFGIVPVSWMIISEIFPYTVRGISCGFVGAVCDVAYFVAAKTYINVEESMHISGALFFYAAFTLAGVVFLYLFLQETEGKTFAQIEANFADKNKKFYCEDPVARKIGSLLCSNKLEPVKEIIDEAQNGTYRRNVKSYKNDAFEDVQFA